jgi:heme-degrading monooxygenase HmoA
MYAAIRQYEIGVGSVRDIMDVVEKEFADAIAGQPGFVAYHVVASGRDEIVSVTIFRDEDSALRSNQVAAHFVRDHLGGFDINLTAGMSGEVMVTRGGP